MYKPFQTTRKWYFSTEPPSYHIILELKVIFSRAKALLWKHSVDMMLHYLDSMLVLQNRLLHLLPGWRLLTGQEKLVAKATLHCEKTLWNELAYARSWHIFFFSILYHWLSLQNVLFFQVYGCLIKVDHPFCMSFWVLTASLFHKFKHGNAYWCVW